MLIILWMSYFLRPHLIGFLEARENCFFTEERAKFGQFHLKIYTEIAESFHISSHTVQDHLKAIFDKVGVRSRREPVGQLFARQYQPRMVSGRDLDANGWFT